MCQRPVRRGDDPVCLCSLGSPLFRIPRRGIATRINAAPDGRLSLAYPNPYLERLCLSPPFPSAESSRSRSRICLVILERQVPTFARNCGMKGTSRAKTAQVRAKEGSVSVAFRRERLFLKLQADLLGSRQSGKGRIKEHSTNL